MLNNVFKRGRARGHNADNVPYDKAIGDVSSSGVSDSSVLDINISGNGVSDSGVSDGGTLHSGVLDGVLGNGVLANRLLDSGVSGDVPIQANASLTTTLNNPATVAGRLSQNDPKRQLAQSDLSQNDLSKNQLSKNQLSQNNPPQNNPSQSQLSQQSPPAPLVVARNLSKSYGDDVIFDKVNFEIYANEFICLIGHSGCGKTTILNALAGLESLTSGQILMNDKAVVAPSLERGVVFQGHALLPWLTVADNIAFAIKARANKYGEPLDFDTITNKVNHYLSLVGLLAVKHKKPAELSGGMKQRVGIARAFATHPKLLLMDEPFGALDALTRGMIQEELVQIVAKTAQTVFMITHDIDEAILLADRIFLMSNGPNAYLAEIVENTLQKPRHKDTMHHDHHYYKLRNHLLDFLVHRSRALQANPHRPDRPKVVNLTWEAWSDI